MCDKNREIEEFAADLFHIDFCKGLPKEECQARKCHLCRAEALYNVGYRKHGAAHWIESNKRPNSTQFICSVCGEKCYAPQRNRVRNHIKRCEYKYCPHCGAEMKGETG